MARTTPAEFLVVTGFGKKCLSEIAEALERFYSSLDSCRLSAFADVVELWRPYFTHPERVPVVRFNRPFQNPNGPTSSGNDPGAPQHVELFDPTQTRHAQLLAQDLPLSTRARNVLETAGIQTLNDLAMIDPDTLIAVKNCGKRTIAELGAVLSEYFALLPRSAFTLYGNAGFRWLKRARSDESNRRYLTHALFEPEVSPLVAVIESVVARLGDRRAAILARRMGLVRGQSKKTLEAIGRQFQLTRERVRQIVEKGLKLLLRSIKTNRPDVYQSIRKLLRANEVVTLGEVVAVIQNLGNSEAYDEKACIRMLLIANPTEAHRVDSAGNLWSSKELTPGFNNRVLSTACRLLRGIPTPCEQVALEVARSLGQFEDTQVGTIQKLLLNPSERLRVEISANGAILHPPRQTNPDRRRAFIYSYIKEQGVPIHIQEIFSALQDAEPELIPDSPTRRTAINVIAGYMDRDDRFAWAGPGTWGLREWGYVSRGGSIAAAALEVLRASSVPLSTARIRKELSHLYRVTHAGVSVALKASQGLTIEKDSQGLWRLI